MTRDAETFWIEYERTTGETVEGRAMGQWLGPGAPREGVWGILVLTDRSFHFLGRKSENWVRGLLTLRGREEPEPLEFRIPRKALRNLKEPRRTRLSRILGASFPEVTLSWDPVDGGEASRAVFNVDDQQGFLDKLRGAVTGG